MNKEDFFCNQHGEVIGLKCPAFLVSIKKNEKSFFLLSFALVDMLIYIW